MLTTSNDVLSRARNRLGTLAERGADPTLSPSETDSEQLERYLGEGIAQIAKDTGRLGTTVTPQLSGGDASVPLPPHVDLVQEAHVYDSQAHELSVKAGETVAQSAQAPGARSGRPSMIGQHAARLWLYPVPDKQYELSLICTMNGAYQDEAPGDDTGPPTLDQIVAQLPAELGRAVVCYVVAEWMSDNGEQGLAQNERARFERDVQKYSDEPRQQRTHEREYQPLGGLAS